LLIRTKDTNRQAEIRDANERANNVTGAFAVSDDWDVTGLTVLLVDDVATTGSTLHEAATAIKKAGADKVLCVAFAGNRQVKNAEPF
ncbi:MAG: ComF family protein, partial [Saccharofermentans sp.]|nr:ComF family protein [Saccharofermentans sp.]